MSYLSEFLTRIVQNSWKWWMYKISNIKISTRINIFHFGVKYVFFSKLKMNFWKILIFATHGLMTILNKCSKLQNDVINILGDIAS